MAENERAPLNNTEGHFLGKELSSQGEKDGKKWKRYKAKFKPSMESEKSFSFTCFDPLRAKNTKQLSDLEEGKQYRICYSEKEMAHEPTNSTYMSKTVIGFYSPGNSNQPQSQACADSSGSKLNLDAFDDFKVKYLEAAKKNNLRPSPVHMLGSFIATMEKERVVELLAKCNAAVLDKKEENLQM